MTKGFGQKFRSFDKSTLCSKTSGELVFSQIKVVKSFDEITTRAHRTGFFMKIKRVWLTLKPISFSRDREKPFFI